MTRTLILLTLLGLAACGAVHPGTPGNEPPSSGTVNPVTGTRSSGAK